MNEYKVVVVARHLSRNGSLEPIRAVRFTRMVSLPLPPVYGTEIHIGSTTYQVDHLELKDGESLVTAILCSEGHVYSDLYEKVVDRLIADGWTQEEVFPT